MLAPTPLCESVGSSAVLFGEVLYVALKESRLRDGCANKRFSAGFLRYIGLFEICPRFPASDLHRSAIQEKGVVG